MGAENKEKLGFPNVNSMLEKLENRETSSINIEKMAGIVGDAVGKNPKEVESFLIASNKELFENPEKIDNKFSA